MEFAYVQVNGTREYEQDNLNTTTVVVLQVILRYLDLYIEMGPLMSENHSCRTPSLRLGGGRGVTQQVWLSIVRSIHLLSS